MRTAEEVAAAEELRRYATEKIPALREAAQSGYEVGAAVLRHIADSIAQRFDGALVLTHGSPAYHGAEWGLREAPSPKALERRKAVLEMFDRGVGGALPIGATCTVMPVQRFELEARRRRAEHEAAKLQRRAPRYDAEYRTVVIVRLAMAGYGDRVIVIPAE